MDTSEELGGINFNLPTCRGTQCHGHGACVPPEGGGTSFVCSCDLGYKGDFCEDTVNGSLSLPLTISVVVVIIGLVILAFIIAKIRQKHKKARRKRLAEKYGYNENGYNVAI